MSKKERKRKKQLTERVVDGLGNARDMPIHDGVREFYDRERITAERLNGLLRLTSHANARARKATRLLWLSIFLTVVDIAMFIAGWVMK